MAALTTIDPGVIESTISVTDASFPVAIEMLGDGLPATMPKGQKFSAVFRSKTLVQSMYLNEDGHSEQTLDSDLLSSIDKYEGNIFTSPSKVTAKEYISLARTILRINVGDVAEFKTLDDDGNVVLDKDGNAKVNKEAVSGFLKEEASVEPASGKFAPPPSPERTIKFPTSGKGRVIVKETTLQDAIIAALKAKFAEKKIGAEGGVPALDRGGYIDSGYDYDYDNEPEPDSEPEPDYDLK
jgi:hypothetical protein